MASLGESQMTSNAYWLCSLHDRNFYSSTKQTQKQMQVLVVGWKNIWTFFGLLLKAISVRNLAHEIELTESSSCDLFFFCDVIVIVILLLFEVLLGIFYYLCVCLFVLFVCLFTFNQVETWLSFPKTRRLNASLALTESSIFSSLLLK